MKPFNLAAIAIGLARCTLAPGTDDQLYPPIDSGTFLNPSANFRPRFRYWIPDASVNLTHLANDIADAGSKGAGGVEVLGYYLYGNIGYGSEDSAPVQVDWTEYGWGTQSWRAVQDAALQASIDNGMVIDFALGPNQSAGVPAEYDSDGLLWDLNAINITLTNGSFDGILPGWGTGLLASASTGLITETVNKTYECVQFFQSGTCSALFSTLKADTLQDITSQVNNDGHLSFQAPADIGDGNYTLFAYYLVHADFKELASPVEVVADVEQSPIETFIQNGSWVVDHFSSTGAQVVIDFWEDYLLNGTNTKEMLTTAGNYLWEDSMEYGQGVYIYWTPKLLEKFGSNRGYNLNKYLPLMFHFNTNLATGPYFITDEADSGDSHVSDYRQTLTELYDEYLQTFKSWANSLGVQYSTQMVYNLPMDMLEAIPLVDAPEIESLGFAHNIDFYRQAAGSAHLAGKRILSSELGANIYEAYQQTLPEMLWDVKRSIAGSVNNFVLHGMPYSGDYPNTTWPSFTTFSYEFSSMHGPHEPAWDFYGETLNYIARLQYLSQTGTPKTDIAFYFKDVDFQNLQVRYVPADLEAAGYTYHYTGPESFALPNAVVQDGGLAPDAQSFRALVVRGNDTMTVFGARKIAEFANSGLPVIFSGGVPSNVSGYQPNATLYINSTLESILALPNVYKVAYDGLACSLQSIGIYPRVAVSANTSTAWYSQWRHDNRTGTDSIYVYNDAAGVELGGEYSVGNITVNRVGTPQWYHAWIGTSSPVIGYSQTDEATTIPLQLKGNQTVFIVFTNSTAVGPHIESTAQQYFAKNTSVLVTSDDSNANVSLSNGSSVALTPPTASAITLGPWSLTIESWTSPSDTSYISTIATRTNLTALVIPSLVPWSSIDESLYNVSGRGYYCTNFTWSVSNSSAWGALIDLDAIYHTAKVWINGAELLPLDISRAVADIGSLLADGTNRVDILVTTPLGNALSPIWGDLRTSGRAPVGAVPAHAEYGLLRDVRVVPYMSYDL